MPSRTSLTALAVTAVVLILAPSTQAHATHYSPDGKIRFTYGHLFEPIFTDQKTGLDLTIRDNATGATLPGYEFGDDGVAKLLVYYRYGAAGGPELNITSKFAAQHGQPGKYAYPIVFSKPGLYYLLLKGVINGTHYDMELAPAHELQELDSIVWPEPAASEDVEARVAALEAELLVLKSQSEDAQSPRAPALEGAFLIVALIGIAALWRRR